MRTKAELWTLVGGPPAVEKTPLRPLAVLCEYRGSPKPPPDGKPSAKDWRACEHPNQPLGPVVCPCAGCGPSCAGYSPDSPEPESKAPTAAVEWVSTRRLIADSIALAAKLPLDCSGVVGVPRSGMIPATVVATQLNLPLWELTPTGPRELTAGSRGRSLTRASGPLAVVDDTVYGGGAMGRAKRLLVGRPAVFAAVLVNPARRGAVDFYGRLLHSPHLLEWNFANNGPFVGRAANPIYGSGFALDLDGIVVHDADSGGPVGSPYLLPRSSPVRLIASGRSEVARPQTEALLRRLGVRWERLELLPAETPLTAESAAEFKAAHYRTSGCGFFVESDPTQAELIWRRSGKPVICPQVERVFQ